jgi:hypothetical protein
MNYESIKPTLLNWFDAIKISKALDGVEFRETEEITM